MAPCNAEASPTRWGLVLLSVGAGVIAAFQVGKVPAALPTLRAELGLGLFESGWLISLLNLLAVLGGMAAGAAADRLGHRAATIAGLALIALANLAGGFAGGALTLLLARLAEGLGFLAIIVSVPSLVMACAARRDLRLALGVWGCYMPVGAAIMLLVSPSILAPLGWRGLWWANALAASLYAIALALGTRGIAAAPGSGGAEARLGRDMRRTLAAPGIALLTLCFMCYSANWLAVLGFLPTYLVEQRGLPAGSVAALTALAVVMNAGGNLLAGWLLHRNVPRWRLIASALLVMGLASLAIYSRAVPDGLRYLACLAFSGLSGVLPASAFSAVPAFAPSPALIATANGLVVQGANLGQMLGPPLLAALVGWLGGWQASPVFILGSSALGLVFALRFRALERRRARAAIVEAGGDAAH